ncbi:MAG: long-chain fatty acid--CoA ligase [Syntrophomonadaceae bacterium]|nr:long-chain fatty acid--CoA ligase [Syntrophomonadaceae bacterium]
MTSPYESRFWTKVYNWKTPTTMRYPLIPAYYILRDATVFQPDKTATDFYGAKITWDQLYHKVTRMANVLVENNIKKGDRVGICLPNCPQFVIAFWAVLMAGGVVVNLNPVYTADELEFAFKDAGLTGLITFDSLVPLVKPLVNKLEIPMVMVTRLADFMPGGSISTDEELGLEPGWLNFSKVLETDRRWVPPLVDIKHDDPAVIQYTGGTTGVPKGAVLTQFNIVAAAYQVVMWCIEMVDNEPTEIQNLLCLIPFFHIYGEVCCILYAARSQMTMVILPRFEPNEVLDAIERYDQYAYFPAVPTMLEALFANPRVNDIDWHRKFVYCGTGAAPAPLALYQKCRQYDFNFYEGYGSSETCALAVSTPGGRPKPGSVGVPYIDMEVRIVDEDGNDVPLGERGELWMRGATVMKEYWNNPEETALALTEDGWLKSGDVVYMDEEGYIFIVDRTKDMIIAGGYNIYPRDIDEVLMQHPAIADVMAVGVPDEYRGETVKAFVQLKPGQTVTVEELDALCRQKLAPYKVPKLWEFRSELPRTNTGKALRRILRDEEIAKQKKE